MTGVELLDQLLNFAGDEANNRALTIIGGAVLAIVGGAWALLNKFDIFKKKPETTQTVTLTIDEYRALLQKEKRELEESLLRGEAIPPAQILAQSEEIERKLADPAAALEAAKADLREFEEAIESTSEGQDQSFEAARTAFKAGDLKRAEQELQRYREQFEPVLKRASDLYLGLAVVAEAKADWIRASNYYSRSAVLFETEENLIRSAIFLWRAGAVQEAFILSRRILDRYRKQYGVRDERVAGILNNLAAQLYDMGQVEEAKSTLTEALSIRDELKLPRDHDYAAALSNLGNIFLVEGDYTEAERLHREALKIVNALGDGYDATRFAARNSLAESIRLQGRKEEAEDLLISNYEDTIDRLGAEHPDVARALNFLAKAQLDSGKTASAARNFLESLRIQQKALGEYHPNSIAIGMNILHLSDHHPEMFSGLDLSELERRYRQALKDYQGETTLEDKE